MTPEQALKLLGNATLGPWCSRDEEWLNDYPDSVEVITGTDPNASPYGLVADVSQRSSDVYDIDPEMVANARLIAAAPDMAAMIANMRTEYAIEYQPNPDSQWHRVSEWSEEYPLIDGEELNPRERIVKRYVTAPQPLGEEQ